MGVFCCVISVPIAETIRRITEGASMIALFEYKEISDILKQKYGVEIGLEEVDVKTIKISYKPALLIPRINVVLNIEEINEERISIHYDSTAINFLLPIFENFITKKIPEFIKIDRRANRLFLPSRIHKGDFNIDISNIEFGSSSMKITAKNIKF